MVTRPIKMSDLPAVFDMLIEMHGLSKYAGDVDVDPVAAKALLMQAAQRHGGSNNGSTHFMVAEEGGKIVGFMVGALQRLYLIGNRLEAMDLFLYAKKTASAKVAVKLLDSYIEWASSCPKVASIKLSYTNTLGVDGERLGALYERKGFERHGAIYEKVTVA